MKKIKYIISIFAVAVMASCVKEIQAPIISVRTVTIDQGDQALAVGQSVKLTASVQPVNATDRDLKWSSSNEDIAMVSAGGKVKALSVGEVAITAEAGGVSDLITVKVVAKLVPVNGVSINPSSTTLKLGETQLLKAEITPSEATNTSVKWTSSNDRVASVEKGLITGIKPGTATITVTTNDGDKTAECSVTVEDDPLPIATLDAENIVFNGATLRGKLLSAPTSTIHVGFQYSSSVETILFGSQAVEASGVDAEGNFSADISELEPQTTYYFRTVLKQDGKDYCGEVKTFTTAAEPVEAPFKVAAVDLGLPSGLKWANANLGADAVEASGDYYAWGETEPYYSSFDPLVWKDGKSAGYNNASYKFYSGGTYTKYYSSVDSKTVLDPEDDAAHVVLGGTWRMPTKDEWTELINNCEWTWVSSGGKLGYTVTGTNSNSIFIPASGVMSNKSLNNVGCGSYWTADLDESFQEFAHYYSVSNEFLQYSMPFYYTNSYYRSDGYTIRAVTE